MNSYFSVRSLNRTIALGATLLFVPLASLWHSAEAQNRRRGTTYRRSPYSKFLRPYRNPATNTRPNGYGYGYGNRRNRPTYGYNRPNNYNSSPGYYGSGNYITQRRYYTAPNGHVYWRTYRVYR